MFEKKSIGLDEAMGALNVMLEEIKSHPEKYWQYACIAIVDEVGNLKAFARMDSPSVMSVDIAIRKARTAALWRRNITEMNAWLADRGRGVEDYLPGSTRTPGGVAIVDPQEVGSQMGEAELAESHNKSAEEVDRLYGKTAIGGIGVAAAGPWQLDLEIANIGLKHIQNKIWPDK